MGYFSAFWSSSRWPMANGQLFARVNWYLQSSLKHITELIAGIKFYYRGGRYRQVSLYQQQNATACELCLLIGVYCIGIYEGCCVMPWYVIAPNAVFGKSNTIQINRLDIDFKFQNYLNIIQYESNWQKLKDYAIYNFFIARHGGITYVTWGHMRACQISFSKFDVCSIIGDNQ